MVRSISMNRRRKPFTLGKPVEWNRVGRALFIVFAASTMAAGTHPRADEPSGKTQPRIAFEEVAAKAGISFQFENGSRGKHDLPEIMGGGVALFDADGDGLLDVYLCNGGPIDASAGKADPPCRLFRNRGGWQFEDVTDRAGCARSKLRDGSRDRRLRRRRTGRPVRHRLARSAALSQPGQLPVRGRDRAGRLEIKPLEHVGGICRSRRRRRSRPLRRELSRLRREIGSFLLGPGRPARLLRPRRLRRAARSALPQ